MTQQNGRPRKPSKRATEPNRSIIDLAAHGGPDADAMWSRINRSLAQTAPEESAGLRSEVKAARAAAKKGDVDASLHRLASLAEDALRRGSPQLAALLCALGANLARTLGEGPEVDSGRSNLRNVVGLVAMLIGRYPEAADSFENARQFGVAASDRSMEAATELNLANTSRVLMGASEAIGHATTALAIYRETGSRRGQAQLLQTLGSIAVEQGAAADAESWLRQADELVHALRQPGLTSGFHHLRGRIAVLRGDLEEAEAALRAAVAAARRAGDLDKEAAALQSWAAVAGDAGRPVVARQRVRKAVEVAEQGRLLWRLTELLPFLIRLNLRAGRLPEAQEAAERLVEVTERASSRTGEAAALLGASLIESGSAEQGIAQLERAWQSLTGSDDSDLQGQVLHNLVLGHGKNQSLTDNLDELVARGRNLPKESAAAALEHIGLSAAKASAADPQTVEVLLKESLALRTVKKRAWASLLMARRLEAAGLPHVVAAVLRVGMASARRSQQDTLIRRVRNDLGLALAEMGDNAAALRLFDQNLEAAAADDDLETVRLARYNSSETQRRLGRPDLAEDAARGALSIAEEVVDFEAANAARIQLAYSLTDQSRLDEARSVLDAVLASSVQGEVRASALSSLAGLTLGEGDPATAVDLYRQSLRVGERHPKGNAETLLGLCEALAAAGNRRAYNAALQRAVDALTDVPFDAGLAGRFVRCALKWKQNQNPQAAAVTLATAVVVGGAHARDGEPLLDPKGPLVAGLAAVSAVLDADWGFNGDRDMKARVEAELGNHVRKRSARTLMKLMPQIADS